MGRCRHRDVIRRLLLLLLLGCSLPLLADDFERGMAALDHGDLERAFELWQPLAEAGHPNAQFGLGVMYYEGIVVPRDYEEANYWFLLAAEQGFAPAQYNLGNAYRHGTGVAPDPQRAIYWWEQAAKQEFGPALYNLATTFALGEGVPRDRARALDYYRRAAATGHPVAQAIVEGIRPVPGDDAGPRSETVTASAPRLSTRQASNTEPTDDCERRLAEHPQGHVVQLMASRQPRSARDFVRRHRLQDTLLCSYPHRGETWQALLLGPFPDRAAATRALNTLPPAVRAGGAYVRSVKSVRALRAGAGAS